MDILNYDLAILIPAKGPKLSVRLENKNALPFGNKQTLLEWKISQLLQIVPASIIYVSTEYEPFKDIAKNCGVNIHNRDPIFSREDKVTFEETICGIIKDIKQEHIAWITVTSPLMQPDEYKKCFDLYNKEIIINKKYDSLTTVNALKEYLWSETAPLNYKAQEGHAYTQNLPNWFRLANNLFIRNRDDILQRRYFLGNNPLKVEVSKLAGIDIDYMEDYEIAEALYPLYLKKIKNLN